MMGTRRCPIAFLAALLSICCKLSEGGKGFWIYNDRFLLDGEPIQIISGEVHYFRIHPYYWEDRLMRIKSLGMNAIQVYVPWNWHEQYPGQFKWDGHQDVEGFIKLAQKLGFMVLLRPGPYICAEWDFGGLPWWLGASSTKGGGKMKIRSSDPDFMAHADRWLKAILPRMEPLLYKNGGPIIMIQVENEFGFIGPDQTYMRHLTNTMKSMLHDDVIWYTTDPPDVVNQGGPGNDLVFSAVDFGASWWQPAEAFETKQAMVNKRGGNVPFVSEYYMGWLSWNGNPMANTSNTVFIEYMKKILTYNNNAGSLNIYMVHGGTNFGWWIGAQEDTYSSDNATNVEWSQGKKDTYKLYQSVMTSYDYDCAISEAGDYGQPGIGGPNKFQEVREALINITGNTPPDPPARPRIVGYGTVKLTQQASLLSQLSMLTPGTGAYTEYPLPMEEFGQQAGLILYRTKVYPRDLQSGSTLYFGENVRDYAQVFVNGVAVGSLERNGRQFISLGEATDAAIAPNKRDNSAVTLDVLVYNMGRVNTKRDWDLKGLISPIVLLSKKELKDWRVWPLPLTSISDIKLKEATALPAAAKLPATSTAAAAGDVETVGLDSYASRQQEQMSSFAATLTAVAKGTCPDVPSANGKAPAPTPAIDGPTFYRGFFNVNASLANADGVLPDTYMNMGKGHWAKGVAFINGFNLGFYWPEVGPANTMYIPGPLLKPCNNEIVMLELGVATKADAAPTVTFTDTPNFDGPNSACQFVTTLDTVNNHTVWNCLQEGIVRGLAPEVKQWNNISLSRPVLDFNRAFGLAVSFTDQPDFYGPANKAAATESASGIARPDLAIFVQSGAMGGHMAGFLSQATRN